MFINYKKYLSSNFFLTLSSLLLILFSQLSIALSITNPVVPRYVSGVESIVTSHQYIQQNPAPLYWKLSPYYLPQLTNSSCSLAVATMIVNAVRSNQVLAANEPLATQDKLLSLVNDKVWSQGVVQDGNGVTLDQLSVLMSKALKVYGLKEFTIEVIHIADNAFKTKARLHNTLVEAEKNGHVFVIANFNQKYISGTISVGHFAPVGAYDAKRQRVLLMDPDRELFEPYWVPEDLLIQSMATRDEESQKYRGYLVIRFQGLDQHACNKTHACSSKL